MINKSNLTEIKEVLGSHGSVKAFSLGDYAHARGLNALTSIIEDCGDMGYKLPKALQAYIFDIIYNNSDNLTDIEAYPAYVGRREFLQLVLVAESIYKSLDFNSEDLSVFGISVELILGTHHANPIYDDKPVLLRLIDRIVEMVAIRRFSKNISILSDRGWGSSANTAHTWSMHLIDNLSETAFESSTSTKIELILKELECLNIYPLRKSLDQTHSGGGIGGAIPAIIKNKAETMLDVSRPAVIEKLTITPGLDEIIEAIKSPEKLQNFSIDNYARKYELADLEGAVVDFNENYFRVNILLLERCVYDLISDRSDHSKVTYGLGSEFISKECFLTLLLRTELLDRTLDSEEDYTDDEKLSLWKEVMRLLDDEEDKGNKNPPLLLRLMNAMAGSHHYVLSETDNADLLEYDGEF